MGYFPLFPWLGFMILGSAVGSWRWQENRIRLFNQPKIVWGSLLLLVIGALVWHQYPGPLYTRCDYSELFYPPMLGYMATAMGLIFSLFCLVDWKPELAIYKPLQVFGESALFMYITHSFIIKFGLSPWVGLQPFSTYFFVYLGFATCLLGTGYALKAIKPYLKKAPMPVRFIFGA